MKNGQRSTKRQVLAAVGIVLLGFAVSAVILFNPFRAEKAEEKQPETLYAVSFFGYDGELIEKQNVREGAPARPPTPEKAGYIFKGWSIPLYSVTADAEAYPDYVLAGDAKNVLYANAVYADSGGDIRVPVKIDGTVDCTGFTVRLEYDGKLLEFLSAENAVSGLTAEIPEDGVLKLTRSSDSALSEPGTLAELVLRCRSGGAYKTKISLKAEEIYTVHNGTEVFTDSTAYDTWLYLFDYEKE